MPEERGTETAAEHTLEMGDPRLISKIRRRVRERCEADCASRALWAPFLFFLVQPACEMITLT